MGRFFTVDCTRSEERTRAALPVRDRQAATNTIPGVSYSHHLRTIASLKPACCRRFLPQLFPPDLGGSTPSSGVSSWTRAARRPNLNRLLSSASGYLEKMASHVAGGEAAVAAGGSTPGIQEADEAGDGRGKQQVRIGNFRV